MGRGDEEEMIKREEINGQMERERGRRWYW